MKYRLQSLLPGTLTMAIVLGMWWPLQGQVVTIGTSEVIYYGTKKNGKKPPLYKKKSVFESPFSPPHDGTLNPNWQMVIDAPMCVIRKNESTFTFFLSQGYGMDIYEGELYDPFKTRIMGTYNQNIAKVSWLRVPGDPLNEEWYPTPPLTTLWPSYTTNWDKLYRGAPPENTVQWEKFLWIVGVYKVTEEDAAAVPSVEAGDLVGITHVEMSAIGQSTAMFNFRYAIGLSISRAADNGRKWTYFGEVINQHAAQYDDVFVPVNNGAGAPGYCIHNISGGAFMRVGDYFHIYFDEFADTLHTPPKKEYVVPCVGVARANVVEVLATLGTTGGVGNIPPDQWKKYRNGQWNEDAMIGRGGSVVPLPASEWPMNYYNASVDGQNTWPAASFSTHTCATACRAFDTCMYLMTLKATTAQFSLHSLTESLMLYRSFDGINWAHTGNIYSRSFPFAPPAPYEGPLVQYACFIANDAAASDDFLHVGQEFYVLYPVIKDGTPVFTTKDPYDADVYLAKITVDAP